MSGANGDILGNPAPIQLVVAHGTSRVHGLPVGDPLCQADHRQALRPGLQHQPLHGIHARGLRDGDLEVLVVEHLHAFAERHVPRRGLPRLVGVLVVGEVGVHVSAHQRHLDHPVGGGHERCIVRPLAVHEAGEARHHVQDVDVLSSRGGRRALSHLGEPLGLALDLGQRHLRSLGEEVGDEHERLLRALALVLVDVGPEEEDRVCLSSECDGVDLVCGVVGHFGVVLAGEHNIGISRSVEADSTDERAPPSLQEGPQGLVVRLRRWVLWLLVLRERQADQGRRALVDASVEHVEGVRLEGRGDVGKILVVLHKITVAGKLLVVVVHPSHSPPAPLSQVTLLDLLGKPCQGAVLGQVLKHAHGLLHGLDALARLQHTEALLED
mmetsp:Transcript_102125/g.271780  ORF Transcript_102125/g.271780 Transcript_102125/m.271780 type:complete len:383 (+) Transcript_102125:1524-2672(+)